MKSKVFMTPEVVEDLKYKTPIFMGMSPRKLSPVGGWKERTYYSVMAAFTPNNPFHVYVFYSGFLQDGEPCGYNEFCCYEDKIEYVDAYVLLPIKELDLGATTKEEK